MKISLEKQIKELNNHIKELIIIIGKIQPVKQSLTLKRLIPLTKWPSYHSYPSIGGLRNMVFNEKTNGASIWIKRVGKRVLIDEEKFFKWAKNNQYQ